jgi:cytochrome c oxidase cbb3-type subunit 3
MSSRFPASLLLVPLALAGCDRETRDFHGRSLQSPSRTVAFGDNAYELAQGQRLYLWMNCGGCHSNGGGGMGPPLRDDEWRYGGSMKQIVSTILNGRPNGMPSFRDRITEEQAWQIASFVRSMSARTRQDILAGRADKPASVEPPPLDERKPVRKATPLQDDATQE